MENPRADDGRESFPPTSFPVTHQPFASGKFFREESRHLLPSLLPPVRIFDIQRQRGTDKGASLSPGTGWRRSLSPIRLCLCTAGRHAPPFVTSARRDGPR